MRNSVVAASFGLIVLVSGCASLIGENVAPVRTNAAPAPVPDEADVARRAREEREAAAAREWTSHVNCSLDASSADGDPCTLASRLAEFATRCEDPIRVEALRALMQDRRTERARYLAERIQSHAQRVPDLRDQKNPDVYLPALAKEEDDMKALRCADSSKADEVQPAFTAYITAMRDGAAAEKTCRATPSCMGERLVEPICRALAERGEAAGEMARERRNPSGYVNTSYLHQLGGRIQDAEAEAADLRKQYAALTKRTFDNVLCRRR